MRLGLARNWMKSWRRLIRTGGRICRLIGNWMGRCTGGRVKIEGRNVVKKKKRARPGDSLHLAEMGRSGAAPLRGRIGRRELVMSAQAPAAEKNIFRKTNTQIGRNILITPANSSMRHLAYGRIILNPGRPSESFSTGDRETGLICLSGEATVTVDKKEVVLGRRDAMYIPRDSSVKIATRASADLAEFSCDVANRYPLQVVRSSEIAKDPGLQFTTGSPGCMRHLYMLLAKNIEAGRLIAGITQAEPGNWTSWPPHEHAALLEEMYVYFDMPEPAYGIQLVYNDTQNPE